MLAQLGKISPGYQRLLLISICIILFCLWLTWIPLTEIDEVRFSEATREMVSSGHYLIPTFNHEVRYQKPILYYWIQAVSIRCFGVNEKAARFPSALAAILLVLLIHAFLLCWMPRTRGDDTEEKAAAHGAALLGALSVTTTPFIVIWARAATTDMTLTLFISATVLALAHADLLRRTATKPSLDVRGWYLLAAVTAALACLTKGPVGIIIPLLIWLCYHLWQRSLLAECRRIPWLVMLGLFLLIAAPWYLVAGPMFLKHFFFTENIERFTHIKEGHGTALPWLGFMTYWGVALAMLFPISPFLLREAITPSAGKLSPDTNRVLVSLRRFAWSWLLAVIIFFSFSRTQLPSYIQCVIGAAGILFAMHILGRLTGDSAKARRWEVWSNAGEATLLVLLIAGILYLLINGLLHNSINMGANWVPHAPISPRQAVTAIFFLGVTGGLFILGSLLFGLSQRATPLIGWVMTTWTLVFMVILFDIGPLAVRSNYQEMALAGKALRDLPADLPIFAYFGNAPETLAYYAQRPIELCSNGEREFRHRLDKVMASTHRSCVLTDPDGQLTINQHYQSQQLAQFGHSIMILSVTEKPVIAVAAQGKHGRTRTNTDKHK